MSGDGRLGAGEVDRRELLGRAARGAALAGLPALLPAQDGGAAGGRRPNLLFIMADDHAAHALSCYGSRINRTPALDRLAAGGALFRNCFVTNSICGPSRAAILTGKYSHANGFRTNADRFDGSQETFPKLLQRAGYQTAMVGKWHLVSEPTGFDYWNILPGQGAYENPRLIEMGREVRHQGYTTEILTGLALSWLERRDAARPFCLMLHHKAPHRNWIPGPNEADLFAGEEIPVPETFDDDWGTRGTAAHGTTMTIARDLTPNDVKGEPPAGLDEAARKRWKYQRFIKDYLRCVAAVDRSVGQVLEWLEQGGLARDTVVVYTSDQGFFLGDHGWFDKRFMYEESLRMPLLVRWPGRIAAGSVRTEMALNVDFAPTFLEMAGVPVPAAMHGRSLLPALQGRTPPDWRRSMYYHYYEYPAVHSVRRHYGLRTERYKLIRFYHGLDEWELFDLERDPRELRNVHAEPAYAPVVAALTGELYRLQAVLGDRDPAAPPPAPFAMAGDAEIRETPFGYEIAGTPRGHALLRAPRPFRRRVTLRCRLRTLRRQGLRNGLIAFGQDADPGQLVKAGVYIGAGEWVILQGLFGGRDERIVRRAGGFPPDRLFEIAVTVELEKRTVTLAADGIELSAPLEREWQEIRYIGYAAYNTATAFSRLEVEGE